MILPPYGETRVLSRLKTACFIFKITTKSSSYLSEVIKSHAKYILLFLGEIKHTGGNPIAPYWSERCFYLCLPVVMETEKQPA